MYRHSPRRVKRSSSSSSWSPKAKASFADCQFWSTTNGIKAGTNSEKNADINDGLLCEKRESRVYGIIKADSRNQYLHHGSSEVEFFLSCLAYFESIESITRMMVTIVHACSNTTLAGTVWGRANRSQHAFEPLFEHDPTQGPHNTSAGKPTDTLLSASHKAIKEFFLTRQRDEVGTG